jgi:hypothetical protein
MSTFWEQDDLGDSVNDAGDNDDGDLTWELQGNSRVGAKVKHENLSGRFELGLGSEVKTRRIHAEWDFGSGKMLVGQTYTPISDASYSNQVFDGDLAMNGVGTPYASRRGMIRLSFGDFRLAFIEPRNTDETFGLDADTDVYLPKIEAIYKYTSDQFFFDLFGGVQTYDVKDNGAADFSVTSWAVGTGGGVKFGAGYVNATISYYKNGGIPDWDGGADPILNASGTDIEDADSWQAAVVTGFKVNDMVSFEAGYGYQTEEIDVTGLDSDGQWLVYVQSKLKVAPGVDIIPEVGYFDYQEDATGADEGNLFYVGARWRISF